MKNLGKWLFIAALVVALIGAFVDLSNEYIQTSVLLVAFAGAYMWIDKEHAKGWFLMALALYFFHGALDGVVFIGTYLTDIFGAFAGIFGVAAFSLVVKKIVGWFM
jgi:hypothetical protein